MPGKLQHSQRGRNQISGTKTACFAFFIFVPAKLEWKDKHNGHAVVQLCVCQAKREDQRDWRPNTSDVVSDFIHSRWRERERQSTLEGKKGEKVWTNSPSHWQDWMTPPSCNTNQSQTCQLDSTCTFPAHVPSSALTCVINSSFNGFTSHLDVGIKTAHS